MSTIFGGIGAVEALGSGLDCVSGSGTGRDGVIFLYEGISGSMEESDVSDVS